MSERYGGAERQNDAMAYIMLGTANTKINLKWWINLISALDPALEESYCAFTVPHSLSHSPARKPLVWRSFSSSPLSPVG